MSCTCWLHCWLACCCSLLVVVPCLLLFLACCCSLLVVVPYLLLFLASCCSLLVVVPCMLLFLASCCSLIVVVLCLLLFLVVCFLRREKHPFFKQEEFKILEIKSIICTVMKGHQSHLCTHLYVRQCLINFVTVVLIFNPCKINTGYMIKACRKLYELL